MERKFKIKTYVKVREEERKETYKNITDDKEPLFEDMRQLLIEVRSRKRVLAENMLLRLAACNKDGKEIKGVNTVKTGGKEIVFWR